MTEQAVKRTPKFSPFLKMALSIECMLQFQVSLQPYIKLFAISSVATLCDGPCLIFSAAFSELLDLY